MSSEGGKHDKLGNQYEAVWTVELLIDVAKGKYRSITVEPFGDESLGVELFVETNDHKRQYHSAKRQKQGGDWSVDKLSKRHPSTGRSILGDLFEKLRTPGPKELRFVSSTGANEIRELTERARRAVDAKKFVKTLSAQLITKFEKLSTTFFDNDQVSAWEALKTLEIIPRTYSDQVRIVENRLDELFYRHDHTDLRPTELRLELADFVLANFDRAISADTIIDHLKGLGIGLRDWKADVVITKKVGALNQIYRDHVEIELINGSNIERLQTGKIIDQLTSDEHPGVLLIAPGGYGKSCILSQCLKVLETRSIPTLCIRLDTINPCATAKQLGIQLDLPASPATVLAGIADNKPCVLLIDQLDALSFISGKKTDVWDAFYNLCQDARQYPNIKLLLACRRFDFEHDHRLRTLGDSSWKFQQVTIDKLNQQEISIALQAAGNVHGSLTEREFEILSVPFHLLMYLQGDPSQRFFSTGELYDRFWDRKRRNVEAQRHAGSHFQEVIYSLAQRMSQDRLTFAPCIVVDQWSADVDAMIAQHILIKDSKLQRLRFFHESFFDYAYARWFCRTQQRLCAFLLAGEQELFRRSQVRQILTYRRENDQGNYLIDLREILNTSAIRFHLRSMVASWISQIDQPTVQEWSIIEPLLFDGELSRYLAPAIRGHLGWFQLLDHLGVIESWLDGSSDQMVNRAIWLLEEQSIQKKHSKRIANMLATRLRKDPVWKSHILRILSWGHAHFSPEMQQLQLSFIRDGVYDELPGHSSSGKDFWSHFYDTSKESPKFFIDVLVTWFIHIVEKNDDGKTSNYLNNHPQNRAYGAAAQVAEAAESEPEYFVKQLLPLVASTIIKTEERRIGQLRDRTWPYLVNQGNPSNLDDALLLNLSRALVRYAQSNPEACRTCLMPYLGLPHWNLSYLILNCYAGNPEFFAEDFVNYNLQDRARLDIGYDIVSGTTGGAGYAGISRMALKAISPFCSKESHQKLEEFVYGFCDKVETESPRYRGQTELLLLRALDIGSTTDRTKARIDELERKFPEFDVDIPTEDESDMLSPVSSPIPEEKALLMNDEQWISAMRKYPGESQLLEGGAVELSRMLSRISVTNRDRFLTLIKKLPDGLNPYYYEALLNGVCDRYGDQNRNANDETNKVDSYPDTEAFVTAINRLHRLENKPCGSAIVGCVGKLSDRNWPDEILEIVCDYAMNDPDPPFDSWRKENGGLYGEDILHHGINTVRGNAARTVAQLLREDASRYQLVKPALDSMAIDHVLSVRVCALEAFRVLLPSKPDRAVELFLKTCESQPEVCGTWFFDDFLHYAILTHIDRLRPLLKNLLGTANPKALKYSVRQITIASLQILMSKT